MMVVLAKVLIGIIATLLVDSSNTCKSIEANDEHTKVYVSSHPTKFSNEYQELLTWISSTKTSTNGI